MRASGILMPVSSLPSPYGIGCFSKEAYAFADRLKEAGQKYWQILPLGPTGYGDSPYQSFSAYAGNPYFIDLDTLKDQGLLKNDDYAEEDFGGNEEKVDYGKLYERRLPVLERAYRRWLPGRDSDVSFAAFCEQEKDWLWDYALFMALKNRFDQKSWIFWEEDIRLRKEEALKKWRQQCADEIGFFCFLQYEFMQQWQALRAYVNGLGIKMIGDIPIYVSLDSSDTWAEPHLFWLDENRLPVRVAGCPPDAFAADGQLWGNPLYDWQYHEKTGYAWWIRRLRRCFALYDVVRVDHFRGFDEYFAIPYGARSAAEGSWMKGPGMKLFDAIRAGLGKASIIAEDLGYVTDSVRKLVEDSGYPSMKVIEFAFDSREAGNYMPYTYSPNCVVYTGTHDNQTLLAWLDELTCEDRSFLEEYLDIQDKSPREKVWSLIRLAHETVADTVIIPMQDYLCLGSEGRINKPSTFGDNWRWRMKKEAFSGELAEKIRRITWLYDRCAD